MKIETDLDAFGFPILTPAAVKRARMHLGWRVADLAARTNGAVAGSTIHAFEAGGGRTLRRLTNRELVAPLQVAGIEFVPHRSRADLTDARAA